MVTRMMKIQHKLELPGHASQGSSQTFFQAVPAIERQRHLLPNQQIAAGYRPLYRSLPQHDERQ
jgi:hypothetical protein